MAKTTQAQIIQNLNAEIAALQHEENELQTKIGELMYALTEEKKAKEQATIAKDTQYKINADLLQEFEQLHGLLDAFECLPRQTPTGRNSWEKRENKVMSRLASFLVVTLGDVRGKFPVPTED